MVPGELADFCSTFTSPVFELFLSVKKKKKKRRNRSGPAF